jgi:asparagine synthase (glutamine-hydrolysing)
MCGIAGAFFRGAPDPRLIKSMTDQIAHRGPDDEGVWIDEEARLGLGHRRLSIIDLSPLGHQPMLSNDGRWVLSYNGEIYNHSALRSELDSAGERRWRGHSDTETLVEAIAAWGLTRTLQKSVGMFALALWDRKERKLHLARDRFGEKPLYYGWIGGAFAFASELKAMRMLPGFDNPVSSSALRLLASRTHIPAPLSIFEHVYKLQPGCILTLGPDARSTRPGQAPTEGERGGLKLERYWSYKQAVIEGLANPIEDENEASERLEATLSAAIAGQSLADVPVGAFLSGGIDSSAVVALYRKVSNRTVRTFTIGFEDPRFNEANDAKAVAEHFGTDHNERYVTVKEAREVIPQLPRMYDEPFADSSQIPTHLVSRFAREQVTVALSGDGGDELFGGYNRYFGTARLWGAMKKLPRPLRSAAGRTLGAVDPSAWDTLSRLLPGGMRPPYFGVKVRKSFRTMAAANDLDDVFATFLDEYSGEASPVAAEGPHDRRYGLDLDLGPGAPEAARMMYCDATSYLPDDILCKVDRASMAVSLETRTPYLDHRVAELAARIPMHMKIQGGRGKLILRKLLYSHAPQALFERPKAGFGIPVGPWLKGPLKEWGESLLDERRLREQGYFDPKAVRRRWDQHQSGERDGTFALWAILMFEAWLEHWRDDQSGEALQAAQ